MLIASGRIMIDLEGLCTVSKVKKCSIKRLYQAVLIQAFKDLSSRLKSDEIHKHMAGIWFMSNSADFKEVCNLAEVSAIIARRAAISIIDGSPNPITARTDKYRTSMKRRHEAKKHNRKRAHISESQDSSSEAGGENQLFANHQ